MDAFKVFPDWVQSKLAFITTEPLPWKESVLAFSWIVWAFESYLLYADRDYRVILPVLTTPHRYRQYPNYSKPKPPPELAAHFPDDKFKEGQKYGASKAKFSAFSLLYNQIIESAVIVFDVYPKFWTLAGVLLAKFGYDSSYEVRTTQL